MLANLLNCDFSLAPKNDLELEKVFEAHVKFNDFAAWLFSPVSRPCLSSQESSCAHDMVTALRLRMNERLLWDIPEIFDMKVGGAANFKKIIRVYKAVLISKTANEP